MSKLRDFSSHTLEGNWVEDRTTAPPLRGNVPDYGFREFTSTAAHDFSAGRRGAPVRPVRFGMVTQASLNEAAYSLGDDVTGGRRSAASERLTMASATTTAREAAMRGSGISEAAAKTSAAETRALLQNPLLAPPAGGPGGRITDRGRKVIGISGEVYRLGDDPKVSTAAQRTWLPAHDPGVKAMLHPPPATMGDTSFLSLPIHGHAAATVVRAQPGAPHGRLAAYAGAPVVVTAVTAKPGAASRVYAGGTQVWADE